MRGIPIDTLSVRSVCRETYTWQGFEYRCERDDIHVVHRTMIHGEPFSWEWELGKWNKLPTGRRAAEPPTPVTTPPKQYKRILSN